MPILRTGGREYRLDRPQMTIGRSAVCDIQVTSGLVSRRHASVSVTEAGVVVVEDLGSRNGVYVNAERVVGSVALKLGDRLGIGDETLILLALDEPIEARAAQTVAALQTRALGARQLHRRRRDRRRRAARTCSSCSVTCVDKALALGRGDEAEHLIATHLQAAFGDATSERGLSPDIARTAAGYAVKLAAATGRASWLDYAVKLYHALDLVLPLALVDEMYVLLRRVRGIDMDDPSHVHRSAPHALARPRARRAVRPAAPHRPRAARGLANRARRR